MRTIIDWCHLRTCEKGATFISLLYPFVHTEINQMHRRVKHTEHNIIGLWTFIIESDHMFYDG